MVSEKCVSFFYLCNIVKNLSARGTTETYNTIRRVTRHVNIGGKSMKEEGAFR
jgi:hypothetical protein